MTPSQIHARRWKTLGVLSLSLVIIGLDNTILNVALPSLQEAFARFPSTLQWMVDAYMLVFAGLLLTHGHAGRPLRAKARAPDRADRVRRASLASRRCRHPGS